MLKVTGIIMIVGASLMILLFIAGFAIGTFKSASDEATGGLYMLASLIGLAASVIQLVAGIMGAINWNKPEKAQPCVVMGIIIIVLALINVATTISINGFSTSGILNLLIGFILPGLYTYGALSLKKSA